MTSLADRLAAELGEKSKSERRTNGARNDGDVFELARAVDTVALLDRLGIEHNGKFATCPGCGEEGAKICDNGGLKCLHNRCSHVGPTDHPGFRSNIDLVAERDRLEPIEAARRVCEMFNIELPERKNGQSASVALAQSSEPEPKKPDAKPLTIAEVIGRWRKEGPLVRVPTSIRSLDEACRGGLPVPWRVFIVGAPSAGKTFVEVSIADTFARAASDSGLCVGIHGVDEEPEDITVRLAQIAGFTVAQVELRDAGILADIAAALASLRIRFYDCTHTIEAAATDIAAWAASEKRKAALFIDSIQTARSAITGADPTPREAVEANVSAVRWAATEKRLLVVATCEANRASYRTDDAAETSNDLAAGAESRAIEFGAQTQLMLRTPKDQPDIIHVRIPKNRRARTGEFWLRIDRDRHTVKECPNPNADPGAAAERTEAKQATVRAEVLRDAEALAHLLVRHPDGLGKRELRAALKAAGHKWGVERLDAARLALSRGHKGVRLLEESMGSGKPTVSRVVPETDKEEP